jgi:hypothetical protein
LVGDEVVGFVDDGEGDAGGEVVVVEEGEAS